MTSICGIRIGRDPPVDVQKIEKMCALAQYLRAGPIGDEVKSMDRVLLGAEVKRGEGLRLHCGPIRDDELSSCLQSALVSLRSLKGRDVKLVCGSLGFRRKSGGYWYEWGGLGTHPNTTLAEYLNNVPADTTGFHCWDWHVWVVEAKPNGQLIIHDMLSEEYFEQIRFIHGITPSRSPYKRNNGKILVEDTYENLRRNFSLDYIPAASEIQRELFRLTLLIYGDVSSEEDREALRRAVS